MMIRIKIQDLAQNLFSGNSHDCKISPLRRFVISEHTSSFCDINRGHGVNRIELSAHSKIKMFKCFKYMLTRRGIKTEVAYRIRYLCLRLQCLTCGRRQLFGKQLTVLLKF